MCVKIGMLQAIVKYYDFKIISYALAEPELMQISSR